MQRFQESLQSLPPFLLSSVGGALTIAQIALAFFLHRDAPDAIEWLGWICLWISAIFGVLPILTFRRLGGVSEDESYINTTKLVDTGIYAVVRHPQGATAWFLICLGVMLVAWHWSSVVLGLLSMALAYVDTFSMDQRCIEKFGDAYRQYMARVPRLNFVVGLFRLVLWQRLPPDHKG